MKKYSLIVAADEKNGIGRSNTLPWRLPEDMKHFVEKTTGKGNNAVIMGRKTWDSLGQFKPLKNRYNIIMSSKYTNDLPLMDWVDGKELNPEPEHQWANSFKKALELAERRTRDGGEIFVIGGSSIYKLAIENKGIDFLYLTRIHSTYSCDCFFRWNSKKFKPHQQEEWTKKTYRGVHYTFEEYTFEHSPSSHRQKKKKNLQNRMFF